MTIIQGLWPEVGKTRHSVHDRYTDAESGIIVFMAGVIRADNQEISGPGPTLVNAYLRHGIDFPRHIQGEFAVAVHDPRTGKTLLARDPAGTVPLYYATDDDGRLFFSTHIRDLLPMLGKIMLDPRKLLDYLTFFWSVDEATFFKGVSLVPQGAVWCDGHVHRYVTFDHQPEERREDEWCTEIVRVLSESAHMHTTADLGCHLSGGVDSSVLTVLIAKHVGRIPAFVSSFPDYESYDETPYAKIVADFAGIELVRVKPRPEDLIGSLIELMLSVEEPKCHPPVFARFILESVAAKHGIKVMVSGRGADELFTGYEWHRQAQLTDHLQRRMLFTNDDRRRLVHRDFLDSVDYSPEEAYNNVFGQISGKTMLERILALDFHTLLANWLVVDHKVSSHFGIRPVAPFLDSRMMELALRIPVDLKRWADEPKSLLKKAVSSIVPAEVVKRKKVGFRTPMGEMLRSKLESFVRETLGPDNSVFWDIFDHRGVEHEITTHFSGQVNRGWQLWALLSVKLWCRLFIDSEEWR